MHDRFLPTHKLLLTSGWACLAVALPSYGQGAGQGSGAEPEEVIVTGARLEQSIPQELAAYGNRLTVVTAEQIENGGYNDVGQVLQNLVPGLYVSPKTGAFDYVDVSLQGSRTNEILWLVDGVRISNRLYNSTTPLDTIPAHMIERLEVLEGGQGLFYGTQSVAGVINVITKGFSDETGGQIGVGADSNDGEHLNAYLRGGSGKDRYVVFASRDQADGFQPFPDADYQPSITNRKRGYDVKEIGVKYRHDFGDAFRLNLGYEKVDGKLDNAYPATVQAAFNHRDEDIFTGTFDFQPSDDIQFYVKTYFHQWDSGWTEDDAVLGAPPGTSVRTADDDFWGFKDYGVNALAKFTPGKSVDYYVGYDYQQYSGRDDVLLIAPNDERVHALFGQIRTTPQFAENVRLAFGLRRNMPSVGQSKSIWNLSGQYDVSSKLYVRASLGTSFRLPDAYELFAIDPNCCVGNPDLKPESGENLNASVGGYFGPSDVFRWEAIYFHRRVENLIVDVDDGSGSGNTIAMNVPGKTRVRGEQLVLGVTPSESWSANLSYTYNNSESNNTSGGYNSIPGIPRDQTAISVNYSPSSQPFGLTLTVNDVGKVYDIVGGVGRVDRGKYTVVDIDGRVFLDSGRRHRLNLRLENAFDETYTTSVRRGEVDLSSPSVFYPAHGLGTPRTVHLSYDYLF
jgi:vitamin B12 transporter